MQTVNMLRRFGSRSLFLLALLVVVVLAIWAAIPSRNSSPGQPTVEAIRQRGGIVVLGSSGKSGSPPEVVRVDLSSAVVDAGLMRTLGQFTGLERLSLDGAKLQPQDWALLGTLPRLRSLSLSRTNVTDADILQLPIALTSLSLSGTFATDKSMSRLAAISGLVSLDLTGTGITPDGLRLLEPLRALKTLRITDKCITAESVKSLQRMQPQHVEVDVSEGMGQKTYELLSVCKGFDIQGLHRDGYVLWAADAAWSHTLSGVVEAVVAEVGLDPQQTAQLLGLLGKQPLEGWEPIMVDKSRPASSAPLPGSPSGGVPIASTDEFPPAVAVPLLNDSPVRGREIASTDEFIRELQEDLSEINGFAVRQFAREKFTAGDVPKLLSALCAAQYPKNSEPPCLFHYAPFLVVQYGFNDPEVVVELDRLMAHKDGHFRFAVIVAFSYGGARPFHSREEWAPSAAADAWAVPRLLRMCQDKGEFDFIRDTARQVLTEIALRRLEYVPQVMPVLVDLLEEGGPWVGGENSTREISRCDISRLAEVDAHAAIAVVPRLRELLKQLDEQFAGSLSTTDGFTSPKGFRRISVLEALSATAHQDPALAHEIALEYLERMKDGRPAGPFATLLSPNTPETNRLVATSLLNTAIAANDEFPNEAPPLYWGVNDVDARSQLASLAKKIRDWSMAKEKKDE